MVQTIARKSKVAQGVKTVSLMVLAISVAAVKMVYFGTIINSSKIPS